jgi:hypothetical protein
MPCLSGHSRGRGDCLLPEVSVPHTHTADGQSRGLRASGGLRPILAVLTVSE